MHETCIKIDDSCLLNRATYNSLAHFTKSVHLNGGKDVNMQLTHRKSEVYLYLPLTHSFVGVHQEGRLREDGGDEVDLLYAKSIAVLDNLWREH